MPREAFITHALRVVAAREAELERGPHPATYRMPITLSEERRAW